MIGVDGRRDAGDGIGVEIDRAEQADGTAALAWYAAVGMTKLLAGMATRDWLPSYCVNTNRRCARPAIAAASLLPAITASIVRRPESPTRVRDHRIQPDVGILKPQNKDT